MAKDKWAAHIADLKRNEKPEALLMVAGSAELMRIAVAWSSMKAGRKKRLSPCKEDGVNCIWHWLWDNADYCPNELFRQLPLSTPKAKRLFESLVESRVLYPDGTLNSYVQKYLRQRVLSLFKIPRASQRERALNS